MSRSHFSASSPPSVDLFDEKEQLSIVHHDAEDDGEALEFDEIIGALEDVLVDPAFLALQSDFFARHAHVFPLPSSPPLPSMPLLFTELHLAYQALIEPFLLAHLTSVLPSFSLASLPPLIAHYHTTTSRSDDPSLTPYNEVLDVLVTLSDFDAFLQQMMEQREVMEERSREKGKGRTTSGRGAAGASLEGFGLQVISLNSVKAGTKSGRV